MKTALAAAIALGMAQSTEDSLPDIPDIPRENHYTFSLSPYETEYEFSGQLDRFSNGDLAAVFNDHGFITRMDCQSIEFHRSWTAIHASSSSNSPLRQEALETQLLHFDAAKTRLNCG